MILNVKCRHESTFDVETFPQYLGSKLIMFISHKPNFAFPAVFQVKRGKTQGIYTRSRCYQTQFCFHL